MEKLNLIFKNITFFLIIFLLMVTIFSPGVISASIEKTSQQVTNSNFGDEEQILYLLNGRTILTLYATENVDNFYVIHSIPPNYEFQAPIYLRIMDNTTANILDYKIEDDRNPPNKIINFTIGPMKKNEKTKIYFEYFTLTKDKIYSDLPKDVEIPDEKDIPEEIKIWLSPTESVQANKLLFKIRSKPIKIRSDNNLIKYVENSIKLVSFKRGDYWPYVEKTIKSFRTKRGDNRTVDHIPKLKNYIINHGIPYVLYLLFPNRFDNSDLVIYEARRDFILTLAKFGDAYSVFFNHGNCAGQANLAAALFRIVGIPAKILITEPSVIGGVYHCITEYFVPTYGWVLTDQSKAINLLETKKCLILKVCHPNDENDAGHGLQKQGGTMYLHKIKNQKIISNTGYRGRRYENENSIEVDLKLGNDIFNITQSVWDYYTQYANRDLGPINNQHIINSTNAQQNAIISFQNSDMDGYIFNITLAYNEYLKIEAF